MTHDIKNKSYLIDGGKKEFIYTEHTFKYMFGILVVNINVDDRLSTESVIGKYKHFVSIKLFGKEVLSWQYFDEHQRPFYCENKEYYNTEYYNNLFNKDSDNSQSETDIA